MPESVGAGGTLVHMVTALNMLLIGLLAGAAAGVAVAWALLSARYRVAAAEAARARADSSAATRSELAAAGRAARRA